MASRAKILNMALESLGKVGDEVVEAVKPSKTAASKAISGMADTADDWGWKGGKPGEITGGIYNELYGKMRGSGRLQSTDGLSDDAVRLITTSPLSRDLTKSLSLDNAAILQLKNSPINAGTPNIGRVMDDFEILETADIPREWTGKLMSSFGDSGIVGAMKKSGIDVRGSDYRARQNFVDSLSNTMRSLYVKGDPGLTKERRETFLALLPEWTESLDDLAALARNI